MGTHTRRRLRDGLIGLCVLAWVGWAQPVLAAAAPPPSASASPSASAASEPSPPLPTTSTRTTYSTRATPFSLTVSPARLTVGQEAVDEVQHLTVANRGQEPLSVDVQLRDFVPQPDGRLSYRPDAPYGAASWAEVSPKHLDLRSGQSEQVSVSFDVPGKREPGDHQVALVFLAPAAEEQGNIRVNRGVGVPTYLTVPGPVDDSVRLNGLSGPHWSWRGHPTLTASLTSTGTVHRDFRGPSALQAGTPGHPGRFSDFTVARGADRVVSTTWDDAPLLCVCHPSVTVMNHDGVPQTVTTRVVVLPWWLPAGLGVVVLGFLVVLLAARRRRSRPAGSPSWPSGPAT